MELVSSEIKVNRSNLEANHIRVLTKRLFHVCLSHLCLQLIHCPFILLIHSVLPVYQLVYFIQLFFHQA